MMLRYLAEQRGVSVGTDITIFHPWERPVETFGPLMVDGFGRSRRSSASPTAACSRGMNAILDEFDENFSALTRPDVMAMVANLMMLLGLLGQLPYEGGFKLAMDAPPAIDEAYPRFRERKDPLRLREAVEILRSPDVAAAIELVVTVLRSQRST